MQSIFRGAHKHFNSFLPSTHKFTNSLIDAPEYAQDGKNYPLN